MHSHFADMTGHTFLQQYIPSYPTNIVAQGEDQCLTSYGPGGYETEIDNNSNLQVIHDPSHMHGQTENSVTSFGYSHELQAKSKSRDPNRINSKINNNRTFAQECPSFVDLNIHESDDAEMSHDSGYSDIAPSCNSSDLAYHSRRDDFLASYQTIEPRIAHQASTDSGYGSKTSSVQFASVDFLQKSGPADDLRNLTEQWIFESSILHTISCSENHRSIGFHFICCGSSRLLELGKSAIYSPPQEVYEFLCKSMGVGAVRLYDWAGNSFLHNLAITGAPWAYFEGAFAAGVDPRHRNAHGQTFAHVLNVSKFQDNLVQCLSHIQALGIDFSLRDSSGRTILHCLFGQPISPPTVLELLKIIDCPGRQLCRRDVSGRTPYDILKETYHRKASNNPSWSIVVPQGQIFRILQGIMDEGVLRLRDDTCDFLRVTADPGDSQSRLRSQYETVIENAEKGIAIEAVDGSNAFHSQAALMILQEATADLGSIERFIAFGIDTNSYDAAGRSPLEATIIQPRKYETELTTSEKVSLLIDMGEANVHSRNRLGHTPLYSAAIRGLDRTVQALLSRKSHVNIRANDGKSLLDAVSEAWNQAFLEFQSGSRQYREAQCSRIEACKVLLERYGAVSNSTPAQALGYPVFKGPNIKY